MRICSFSLKYPLFAILLSFTFQAYGAPATVHEAIDSIASRFREKMTEEQLGSLDESKILGLITPEERKILSEKHLEFDISAPGTVYLMRHTDQAQVPFWLTESGFEKTELTVANSENWVYEVWRKDFKEGHVALGINGFDNHRPHYFVSISPADPEQPFEITNMQPSGFQINRMREGAFVYHDWDSLLLKEVPRELRGGRLLTTIRGRAREAHLIGAFRKSAFPSSTSPDQILLSWSEDPKTTQTIQWRTGPATQSGIVRYRKEGAANALEQPAVSQRLSDSLIINDPAVQHHSATLRGLEPGAAYLYQVGAPGANVWSEEFKFRTAPEISDAFSFLWFGDTHNSPEWGALLNKALEKHPEAAFVAISGDLVGTGQHRDDWDSFFGHAGKVLASRPLVSVIGNHDAIDGLGAGLYRTLLGLPENGPADLESERVYTVEYGNALFLGLDSGLSALDQAAWMEERLAASKASWKFALFHFPPYSLGEPYLEISSLWGYLFDKYHLDFALEGHEHYYMRSKPIYRGRTAASPADGTIHIISIGIPGRGHELPPAEYAEVQFSGKQLYQLFTIDGGHLAYQSFDANGATVDRLEISK